MNFGDLTPYLTYAPSPQDKDFRMLRSVPDPWHFGVDPVDPDLDSDLDADPDPSIFITDLQYANKKLI